MRSVAFVLLTLLLACSATAQPVGQLMPDGQTTSDGGGGTPPAFHVTSSNVDVNPGDDFAYCYYFQTDNPGELTVQHWASRMTPGVQDMIVYLTTNAQQKDGTMSPAGCGYVAQAGGPVWAYAAQTSDVTQMSEAQLALPNDDGSGTSTAVGQLIKARQAGFLQIHYVNTGSTKLHASVEIDAYAYPDGTQVTFAAPFTTFYVDISIMPGSSAQPGTGMVNGSCSLPLDPTGKPLRFFGMTSHTYKQGVHTFVKDGVDTVLDNTNWANPTIFSWPKSPFYTFKSGKLFYQCEYSNPTDRTIKTGDNPATDELCMTTGYFFPAPTDGINRGVGHFCSDSNMIY
jgi:hypothetical protein